MHVEVCYLAFMCNQVLADYAALVHKRQSNGFALGGMLPTQVDKHMA